MGSSRHPTPPSDMGAASMLRDAVATARAADATGEVLVRGDSAYGTSAVVAACRAGARFSLVLTKNRGGPGHRPHCGGRLHPCALPRRRRRPGTGALISDAEVTEVSFTAFTSKQKAEQVTARLIVRRVRDASPDHVQVNAQGQLFRAWRHHPFFTDTEPVAPRTSPTAATRSSKPSTPN